MLPSSYVGIHTSLYKALSEEATQHIEHAIWLKITGQIDAARAVFEKELKLLENVAIIVIERADLELDAGRWGRAWRIVNSALQGLIDSGANLDLPENRLIALIRAMTGVRHRGDVDSSAMEIERTKQWLQHVPVADYTDVQVRLLSVTPAVNNLTSLGF
jgi:hypothetical protein